MKFSCDAILKMQYKSFNVNWFSCYCGIATTWNLALKLDIYNARNLGSVMITSELMTARLNRQMLTISTIWKPKSGPLIKHRRRFINIFMMSTKMFVWTFRVMCLSPYVCEENCKSSQKSKKFLKLEDEMAQIILYKYIKSTTDRFHSLLRVVWEIPNRIWSRKENIETLFFSDLRQFCSNLWK